MHEFDLGLMKTILNRIINNRAKLNSKFTAEDVEQLTTINLSFVKYVPIEFNRKPRSLKYVGNWKAVDFRFLILYSGMILFQHPKISNDLYEHFLVLSYAYRIINTPRIQENRKMLSVARELLSFFVSEYRNIYGCFSVTYNVHNLLHVVDAVEKFGSADTFSNYKFESYLNELKRHIRKKTDILQQLHNRLFELQAINQLMETKQFSGPFQPFPGNAKSFQGYKFDEFTIKINDADNCVKIQDGTDEFPFLITQIFDNDGTNSVKGHRFSYLEPFRTFPFDTAELLGIYKAKGLEPRLEVYPVAYISLKYVRLPMSNTDEFLLSPMIHHL
jgi:hypothetical protein